MTLRILQLPQSEAKSPGNRWEVGGQGRVARAGKWRLHATDSEKSNLESKLNRRIATGMKAGLSGMGCRQFREELRAGRYSNDPAYADYGA